MNIFQSKVIIKIIIILCLSILLRFWRLGETMQFIGDFGWYYLQAKDVLLNHTFPLVGITSSVPILKQGAVWTYLLAGALYLGKFDPLSGGILGGFLGTLGVLGTYFTAANIWNRKVGLIAGLIGATFPFIIFHDRIPFQTTAIFPVTVLFAWIFLKGKINNAADMFLLGLVWGILFQLELAAFIILPVIIIVYLIKQVKLTSINLLSLMAGAFWGILPFWIYDLKNGVFIQIIGFAAWFITKVYENMLTLIILGIIVFVFRKWVILLKNIDIKNVFIIIWSLTGVLSFIIRGIYSEAYIPLIYFPILVIFGIFFDKLINKSKYLGASVFSVILIINIFSVIKRINSGEMISSGYRNRLESAKIILEESRGRPVSFVYTGPSAQFQSGDNHWKYLLWWEGVVLSDKPDVIYSITEKPYNIPKGFENVRNIGNFTIGVKTSL